MVKRPHSSDQNSNCHSSPQVEEGELALIDGHWNEVDKSTLEETTRNVLREP